MDNDFSIISVAGPDQRPPRRRNHAAGTPIGAKSAGTGKVKNASVVYRVVAGYLEDG